MEVTDLNDLLNVRTIKMESVDNVFDEATGGVDASDPLSVIPQYVTESDLGLMQSGVEILQAPLAVFEDAAGDDDTMQSNDSSEEVIVQLMDIRTRLSKLRTLLEHRLGVDLSDYTFWLQDAKMLEPHKTLVEQCIRGEGVVQVNVQVKAAERKINILDVLKPDEELVALPTPVPELEEVMEEPACDAPHAAAVKWVVDAGFKAHHSRANIPDEPADWSVQHVKLWIQWAVRQFNLAGVKLSDWHISGWTLCALTNLDFKEKVPSDPGDLFWTHFELLRKCKFIAVVQNHTQTPQKDPLEMSQSAIKKRPKTQVIHTYTDEEATFAHTRNGNNGQVQLWQFLLELLTSAEHLDVIRWHGTSGEFKLLEPERVARLWGARKHKPAMNYEKLSRALRYYYDGDMIAKVAGKRSVYKFKLLEPERVARLWGARKHKPAMNYEKLSRALRYYYDGDMIAKVAGKRSVYKFKLLEPERVARLWGARKHKPAMNYEKLSRALRYYYDGDMIAKVAGKRSVYKFKLLEPERVARLWGARKHKPAMNYEKLSRALRYYYDGDMIAKVAGKRSVYKFKLLEPERVARLWGARKHKPAMNYEKLSRALRYYYDGDMIAKVAGKRSVYKFKLLEPERVARLWGARKHKPAMNYEKLSRALRYYYDGDMIAKVAGKRSVYKFKLLEPERVARLWGARKHKPAMNYEKLSRALRYYYDGDMIAKVAGKRSVYKFKLLEPERVARLWGARKHKPAMNYEKLSRALRYYYDGDMIAKVAGKRSVYKFKLLEPERVARLWGARKHKPAMNYEKLSRALRYYYDGDMIAKVAGKRSVYKFKLLEPERVARLWGARKHKPAMNYEKLSRALRYYYDGDMIAKVAGKRSVYKFKLLEPERVARLWGARKHKPAMNYEKLSRALRYYYDGDMIAKVAGKRSVYKFKLLEPERVARLWGARKHKPAMNYEKLSRALRYYYDGDMIAKVAGKRSVYKFKLLEPERVARLWGARKHKPAMNYEKLSRALRYYYDGDMIAKVAGKRSVYKFKLLEPERVARLWGARKHKPAMNYEKLSRALRYYYDGDMIAKVAGKRSVYKFKLLEPERVARLWGARKHKPAMNYEKLSRALRYYYDGDMIAKVAGKRSVYKFKLLEPERVARLWGARKHKPAMNYEKLSRALRYYYDGDMIAKVAGKRSVYKFKLLEPERVARLWGARKHKPAMNYEKLSRALRYYYDGDMIAKVAGKRSVYKFKLLEPERVARLWGARKHKPAMNYEKLSRALRYYYDGDMIAKVAGKRSVYKFKLLEPERVARLWGARKHKPAMNYEKLSRALRYYYDGDMIAKVAGKRFVYKFVCDLQQLLGYGAGELAELVQEVHENRQTHEEDL